MTKTELDAIKARAEAATPGPWFPGADIRKTAFDILAEKKSIASVPNIYNAEFIAHAREDIPDLLEDRKSLLTEVERLSAEIAFYKAVDDEHTYAGLAARTEWYRCNTEHIAQLTAELADYHHSQKIIDGQLKQLERLRRICDNLTARAKGCEYCNPDNIDYYYAGNVPNYCKHCGRDLTKEAQG